MNEEPFQKQTPTGDNVEFWNQCYADEKTGWDRGEVHPAFLAWLESGELQVSSIAVPGCGRGHEVALLASNGYQVTALDIADKPVQLLRQRLGGLTNAEVVQQSIFEFQPITPFQAVYEQTCLCAIQPDLRGNYEKALFDWLEPGGKLFALFAQTENASGNPPFHCEMREMKSLFASERWDWSDGELKRFEHPSGKLFELATVLIRRPSSALGH